MGKKYSDKAIEMVTKFLCEEFDHMFQVAAEAQFKKEEDLTEDEKIALETMDRVFFSGKDSNDATN